MNLEDLFISPIKIETEPWQLGSTISNEVTNNSIVLISCLDKAPGRKHFCKFRQEFYKLSKSDFEIPICDLGDLIFGKTIEDTHYILQEISAFCLERKAIPIFIGGSNDFTYPLFRSINFFQKEINYTQINSTIQLSNEENKVSEKNFLFKIFSDKKLKLKNYYHLGYQKHLNAPASINLMKEIDFEVLRLADMMGNTDTAEPFLRRADLVTLSCDAIESFSDSFSINPQVNGLNRREICAYMKEIGLGENLKAMGVFNFNSKSENPLNYQLLAQMIWYLIEGINIQKTHPKESEYETFIVMIGSSEYFFKRDVFSGKWYFGESEFIEKCIPCSEKDYNNAKKGILAKRFK